MSKNMTRKGLAFGAGFALVASGVAGSPAFADEHKITLAPSAGSGNNVISGSTFDLRATLDSNIPASNYGQLRYRVQNPDKIDLKVEMVGEGGTTSSGADNLLQYVAGSTVADAVGFESTTIVKSNTTDFHIQFDADGGTGGTVGLLTIHVAADIADNGDVISFDNLDGTIGNETGSATQTELDALLDYLNNNELTIKSGGASSDPIAYVFDVPDSATVDVTADLEDIAPADLDSGDSTPATLTGSVVTNNIEGEANTRASDFVVEPNAGDDPTIGSPIALQLSSVNKTDAGELTITAFLDTDGSNTISGNEAFSEDFVMEFIPGSSAIASVSMVQPLIGDNAVTGLVSFANDINEAQIDTGNNHVKAVFTGDVSDAESDPVNYSYDSTLGGFVRTATDVAAGEEFTVSIFTDTTADANGDVDITENAGVVTGADSAVEDSDTASVGTVEADVFTISLVEGDGVIVAAPAVKDGTGTNATDFTNAAGTATVREGVESVTLTGFVGTDEAEPAAVDGKVVSVTVTPSGVTAADDFAVNGEDVPGTAAITETTVTDDDGNWSMVVDTAGLDDADSFTVSVLVDDVSSIESSNGILTVTVAESDYDLIDVTDVTGENERTIEEGDTVTMNYRMVDQFGDAPDNGEYRVAVSEIQNNRATTDADIAASANVVDGVATVTFTDNGEGTGTTTVRAAYGEVAGALSTDSTDRVSTEINVVDDAAAASITLADLEYGSAQYVEDSATDNRKALLLEDKAFGNYDANLNVPGAEAPEVDNTYAVTVSGTIENADGDDLAGAPITMSATGLLFKAGSVYGDGEITFVTDSSGDFEVDVWSQVGGTRTITMTSGDLTDTTELTYAGGAAGSEDDLSVATVADVTPGTTTNVVATVQDDKGNGVKGVSVSFTTTIGYMAQATVTTDANGVAVGKLVTAPNDNGASTVTVSIPDNDDIAADTQTVNVGTVASADQKVNAGSFKGFVALYAKGYEGQRMSAIVAGKWLQVDSLASNFERVVRFTGAGYDIKVRIYIDGVQVGDEFDITTK